MRLRRTAVTAIVILVWLVVVMMGRGKLLGIVIRHARSDVGLDSRQLARYAFNMGTCYGLTLGAVLVLLVAIGKQLFAETCGRRGRGLKNDE